MVSSQQRNHICVVVCFLLAFPIVVGGRQSSTWKRDGGGGGGGARHNRGYSRSRMALFTSRSDPAPMPASTPSPSPTTAPPPPNGTAASRKRVKRVKRVVKKKRDDDEQPVAEQPHGARLPVEPNETIPSPLSLLNPSPSVTLTGSKIHQTTKRIGKRSLAVQVATAGTAGVEPPRRQRQRRSNRTNNGNGQSAATRDAAELAPKPKRRKRKRNSTVATFPSESRWLSNNSSSSRSSTNVQPVVTLRTTKVRKKRKTPWRNTETALLSTQPVVAPLPRLDEATMSPPTIVPDSVGASSSVPRPTISIITSLESVENGTGTVHQAPVVPEETPKPILNSSTERFAEPESMFISFATNQSTAQNLASDSTLLPCNNNDSTREDDVLDSSSVAFVNATSASDVICKPLTNATVETDAPPSSVSLTESDSHIVLSEASTVGSNDMESISTTGSDFIATDKTVVPNETEVTMQEDGSDENDTAGSEQKQLTTVPAPAPAPAIVASIHDLDDSSRLTPPVDLSELWNTSVSTTTESSTIMPNDDKVESYSGIEEESAMTKLRADETDGGATRLDGVVAEINDEERDDVLDSSEIYAVSDTLETSDDLPTNRTNPSGRNSSILRVSDDMESKLPSKAMGVTYPVDADSLIGNGVEDYASVLPQEDNEQPQVAVNDKTGTPSILPIFTVPKVLDDDESTGIETEASYKLSKEKAVKNIMADAEKTQNLGSSIEGSSGTCLGEIDDSASDLMVSIVTWNLAEESPSEEDALFIKRFRKGRGTKRGSDLVLISGQECENIKPRRTEGSRSREFRRLMIMMLGQEYVPIALHLLGGIQFGLFCKRSILGDVEQAAIADVTCGIGNVFHNKGAIGCFVQLKANNQAAGTKARRDKSIRMLFITSHMAAHVTNTASRDADFWRIVTELEGQAPDNFLSKRRATAETTGTFLLDSTDRIFFCGDLNYRLDLPREDVEYAVWQMDSMLQSGESGTRAKADDIRKELLRSDQLLASMALQRSFPGFAEGRIAFNPTFKFDKGSDDYDTSHKQRIPAWTDRILFKPEGTRVVEYDSVPMAKHSDHRPVFATFRVSRAGREIHNLKKRQRKRNLTPKS